MPGQDSISDDDLERFRLRRFVETLSAAGELITHDAPCDLVDLPALIDEQAMAVHVTSVGAEARR